MSDFVPWLRELAEQGGKGVVNNIDARSLGRIADELEQLQRDRDMVKALQTIIEANDDFRKGMPDGWEGDPLQDACEAARRLVGGQQGD